MKWRGAGYDPQGLPRFLDRLTQNKGATGNFFSDLFGLTRPESKRLRELIKGIETIPAACRQPRENTGDTAFHDWQKTVAELRPEDLTVAPSNLTPTLRLSPKLRPEVTNIKFSPDGRLLLARMSPASTSCSASRCNTFFEFRHSKRAPPFSIKTPSEFCSTPPAATWNIGTWQAARAKNSGSRRRTSVAAKRRLLPMAVSQHVSWAGAKSVCWVLRISRKWHAIASL